MDEIIYKSTLTTATAERNVPPPKLALIAELLDAFHSGGITYCHWKSNEHLGAAMTADTDLDILFEEKQKERVESLLGKLGFKKFKSIRQKQYKDIEDFIGLDLESGKIVHVHTHFRLTMGEAYLKGYQLNLEERVLNSRVFDETFGIYRTNPVFELILLYFREALKIRNRDIAGIYLNNKVNYTGNILNEYKWLKQRTTEQEIKAQLKTILADYRPVYKLMTGDFNRKQVFKLSVLIKKEFKNHRLFSPLMALGLRWYREASVTIFKKLSRVLNTPLVSQRIDPRGGFIVAVIGADGSGKSTVVTNLQSTFRKKLDVYRIYFGNGRAGQKSWPRKLLAGIKKMSARAQAKTPGSKAESGGTRKKKGFRANLFKCLEAFVIAKERHKNLKQMQAAKKKGMLVICDRFPQNQVMGYNDGPMLHHLSKSPNPVFRAMSKMEARFYANAEQNPPDVVFKLIAEATVIQARKPSAASLEMLEAKVEGIRKLKFAEGCRVITVDATQPLETVLFIIKKELWAGYP